MRKARIYQGRSPSTQLAVTNLPQGAVTSPYSLRRARIQAISRQQRGRRVDTLTLLGYKDALRLSILAAVVCFPPIGLVALAFSIKAYLLAKRQDTAGAIRVANVAACLGLVNVLLGVLFWFLLFAVLRRMLSLNPDQV